jgi:hypothetical protein
MKQVYVAAGTVKGYYHLMQYVEDITSYPQQESIEKRLEIIQFFDKYGKEATEIAYKKKRSTVYLWKQKLKIAETLNRPYPDTLEPDKIYFAGYNPYVIDGLVHAFFPQEQKKLNLIYKSSNLFLRNH